MQTASRRKPRHAGGTLDRAAKLVAPSAEQVLMLRHCGREAGVVGASTVEIGAEGDHDDV